MNVKLLSVLPLLLHPVSRVLQVTPQIVASVQSRIAPGIHVFVAPMVRGFAGMNLQNVFQVVLRLPALVLVLVLELQEEAPDLDPAHQALVLRVPDLVAPVRPVQAHQALDQVVPVPDLVQRIT